jgi:NAD(P)-dependent dehydrogenase (short-subunit alcohol dehydrogenase family)
MDRLEGKVALITGAASGFGRAASLLFSKEGASIVVVDIVARGGEETVKKIESDGGKATYFKADVSVTEDVKGMIKAAVNTYGKLDILFNNAGVAGDYVPITEMTEGQWDRGLNVNTRGVWLGMKYAIPEMLKRGGGVIINTASISGFAVVPGTPPEYNVSKAATIMLTKTAAAQFADKNIRVNCICPGHCLTPIVINWLHGSEEARKEVNGRQLIRRMGTAEEIAQVALFLASDECSSFITGEALVADGGHTILARGTIV